MIPPDFSLPDGPDRDLLIRDFQAALTEGSEDQLLLALSRMQSALGDGDLRELSRSCLKEAIAWGVKAKVKTVGRFFGFSDSFSVPVEVSFRRQVIEETSYEGYAWVKIEDLSVDDDGSFLIAPGSPYSFERGLLQRLRQEFKGETEAKWDESATYVVSWKKRDVRPEKRT